MIERLNDPVMNRAVNVIFDMSEDAQFREIARLREKALHDEASLLGTARREGIAEGEAKGRAEGRAEERADIIAQMRASGMTEEQIQSILNTPIS